MAEWQLWVHGSVTNKLEGRPLPQTGPMTRWGVHSHVGGKAYSGLMMWMPRAIGAGETDEALFVILDERGEPPVVAVGDRLELRTGGGALLATVEAREIGHERAYAATVVPGIWD